MSSPFKHLAISLACIVITGAAVGAYVLHTQPKTSRVSDFPINETYFDSLKEPAPTTTFNTIVAIPHTTIRIAYPKDGFYGGGARIENPTRATASNRELLTGISIAPASSTQTDREMGIRPVLSVQADKTFGDTESLEEVGKSLADYLDASTLRNGFYKTVRGRLWLFIPQSPDTWSAFTVYEHMVIHVTLTSVDARDIQAATERNGKLFLAFLEHLRF